MASATDFISNLGDILNDQFESGDNKNKSLDIAENGTTQRYGKLGDFANSFDQSAQRSYTEEGAERVDYFSPKPKQLDIILQDPDITVLVKKRFASSLAENYRPDLMDQTERLFLRATKVLFQNKATQIAAFEKLSKIERISNEIGNVDYHLLPILFSVTDELFSGGGIGTAIGDDSFTSAAQSALSGFKDIIDRVREVVAFSQDSDYTSWITSVPDSFRTNFGEGTGVLELTNIAYLTTTVSCSEFARGSFSLNFQDPYNLMTITNLDIEQAISDTINKFYANSYLQLGITNLDQIISDKKQQLTIMRTSRGANPIVFQVDPDTYLGKRVRALIDNIGFEIQFDANFISNLNDTGKNQNPIDPSALLGSSNNKVGNDGLNSDESTVFNDIVSSLYTQLSLVVNTRKQAAFDNKDPDKNLNTLRKKLRLQYGNKLIIQPMDNVHIYIGSKKKIDSKIVGGLQNSFSGLGFLQGIGNILNDIKDTFNVFKGYSLEKSIFVGNDFPNWLWLAMKNQFTSEKNGAHVFAGVVDTAVSRYSDGAYTVEIGGGDNAAYFTYGIVNQKPSLDVFNGSLYDPLTPFKIEFDSVTGAVKLADGKQTPELLKENIQLFSSAFVKDKNGLLKGTTSTETQFLSQDSNRFKGNSLSKTFYDPEGMVYRWKEGIGTLVLSGNTYQTNGSEQEGLGQKITNDPFAGQDIMNVMSLLVTGTPYNFATFYKAAIQFDNYHLNPLTGEPPANSYFRGLQQGLQFRNTIYGNFVPFKKLEMDDATYAQILNNQLNVSAYDQDLNTLLTQRATLADKIAFLNLTGTPNAQTDAEALSAIDAQIQNKINNINGELKKINKPITIVGDDISVDYDPNGFQTGDQNRLDSNVQKDLRKKIAYLTRRLAWKVRGNEDVNFFIVDDTYDKDYDIQAFEKQFLGSTDFTVFKSDYITVSSQISNIAKLLDLEVFCNTQGHIEVRNKKYNRTPSSVFYKMFRMKDQMGIQIYPQFLEDLYVNQLDQLYTQIEVLEDEIRLYCLAVGNNDDASCVNFIVSSQKQGLSLSGITPGKFQFLSDPNDLNGKILNSPSFISIASNPDQLQETLPAILNIFSEQTSVSAFDIATRSGIVQSNLNPPSTANNPKQFADIPTILNSMTAQTRQNLITSRLQSKTGMSPNLTQIFGVSKNTVQTKGLSSVDLLSIVNNISSRIVQRQQAIKLAANALRNLEEAANLFEGSSGSATRTTTNKLLIPSLYGNGQIPQVFEHMIEDESYDDLGPGSGSRYIIKNHDIISLDISENKPDFTSIEVTGRAGDQFLSQNDLPSDLNAFNGSSGGNAMTTAAAVDYDMWRMYGISLPTAIDAPFLQSPTPENQMAPYAVAQLNTARKNIIRGNATIIGNEYQQPGEVIYIENRDMLFYVDSVTHNFTFGSQFITSINLTYGHNPGEYIPTMLDVVGKVLYNNKNIPQFINKRQNNTLNQQHIGTIAGNYNVGLFPSDIESDIVNGPYGEANRSTLKQIINYASTSLQSMSDNYKPVLEIRIFYNSANGDFSGVSQYATSLANAVFEYLIGKSSLNENTNPTGDTSNNVSNTLSSFTVNQQVFVYPVDTNPAKQNEFRYPSNDAFAIARAMVERTSTGGNSKLSQQDVDTMIYNYITDCWIYIQNPNDTGDNG